MYNICYWVDYHSVFVHYCIYLFNLKLTTVLFNLLFWISWN